MPQHLGVAHGPAFGHLLAGVQLGMLQHSGVVAPPGQAGGEALARSLVLYVLDAEVAVKWCIPEELSDRGIRSL